MSTRADELQEQISENKVTLADLEKRIKHLEKLENTMVPALARLCENLDPDQRQELLASLGLVPA